MKDRDPAHLGALLRAACDAAVPSRYPSRAKLAEAAGLAPTSLTRALKNKNASARVLRAVCRVLKLRATLVPDAAA